MISAQNKLNRREDGDRDREIQREICDRGDGDERRMRGGWGREKQNAGQASKDYCMKVV